LLVTFNLILFELSTSLTEHPILMSQIRPVKSALFSCIISKYAHTTDRAHIQFLNFISYTSALQNKVEKSCLVAIFQIL